MKIAGDEHASHRFVALCNWHDPHVGEELCQCLWSRLSSLEFDDYRCALSVFGGDVNAASLCSLLLSAYIFRLSYAQ